MTTVAGSRAVARREVHHSNQRPDLQSSAETHCGAGDVASGLTLSVIDGFFPARPGNDGVLSAQVDFFYESDNGLLAAPTSDW
jgi:hypothetical protein